ncbi:hypothetical protein [Actinomadura rayongensis]|uniref:Uncharacterized protein n=1 Tax=Actinomadura rayongensis TaxID=1429076 RepID=A0A6I4W4Z1_9ACTN|nr:hypothetical protein [Actinomadura rayongensis]MXQ63475.1 hypothetical protein [Actinomadura rayongensis]
MGVDWVRMRPLPGVPRAVLDDLVEAQADWYAASGALPDDLRHLPVPPKPRADPAELRRHVARDGTSSFRVAAFALNPVFPAEWRRAAFRTHLPGDLARRLRGWTRHRAEVRAGRHRPYLRAWHAHVTVRNLVDEWTPLRERAFEARDRTSAWAVRPELAEIRERILALPVPQPPPPPRWDDPPAAGLPLPFEVAPFAALAREWNRRVPRGQKAYVTPPVGFASFLAAAVDDAWLDACLAWLDDAVRDGCGVLLW